MGVASKLFVEYDYDIAEDFIIHYSIMSYQMENLVISLSKPEKYQNSVNELFRIMHNIKSASQFLKIRPIAKLSVLGEEILEEARSLEGPASEEFIDWLLFVSDQFVKYKHDLEADEDDFSELDRSIINIPTELEAEVK